MFKNNIYVNRQNSAHLLSKKWYLHNIMLNKGFECSRKHPFVPIKQPTKDLIKIIQKFSFNMMHFPQ